MGFGADRAKFIAAKIMKIEDEMGLKERRIDIIVRGMYFVLQSSRVFVQLTGYMYRVFNRGPEAPKDMQNRIIKHSEEWYHSTQASWHSTRSALETERIPNDQEVL